MKKFFYIATAFIAFWCIPACSNSHSHEGHDHHDHETHEHHDHEGHNHEEHEHEGHEHHDHEVHNHNGHEYGQKKHSEHEEGVITLEPARAEKLGVKSELVSGSDFAEVLVVSGQIMPSPENRSVVTAKSSGILNFARGITEGSRVNAGTLIASVSAKGIAGGDPNESAKNALDAAKTELDRITPLAKEGIVSKKDYNAALLAYQQAKAAFTGSGSGSSAVSSQKGVITSLLVKQGEFVEAGTPIAEISGSENLTLRADLPEKSYSFLPRLTSANFRTGASDETFSIAELKGKRVAEGAISAANSGYIPVYFTFANNGSVIPGSFAEVFLLGSQRHNVLSVPLSSLYEQQGQKFIFIKLDEDCYEKRPVKLGGNDGTRVEILSGLKNGETVVTEGVTFVRLAENAGAVPEGHSHNHSH